MRTLNAAGLALLARIAAGERIGWVQLIELQLSTTLRLTTAGHDVPWDGFTWTRASVGTIAAINDDANELQGLEFSLPGVPGANLSLALTEPVEGKTVRVWDALITPETGQVADAVLAWAGTLNVPSITYGPEALVSCTAEHRGVQAVRAKPSRYTNDEQQRISPGDTSLYFDPATDAAPLAWPKASFFRQG